MPSSAGSHTPAPSVVQTTITNDIWLGGVGNWNNAALWSTGIPTASSAVLIDNGNPVASTVTLNVNGSANSLTINSGDALTMNNATVLTISGSGNSLANAGTISMNSDGNTTKLVIDGNVTLGGGGTLTMSANVNNVIIGAATTDTLTNQETIQGSGSVGGGEMTLVNSGTIDADHSTAALTIAANGGTTNAGTLEATAGGTLGFSGTTVTNTGGTINTSAGGIAASNSVINGGTVMLAGGSLTSSTISGANVTVAGTGDLKLSTGTIDNGTLKNSAEIEVAGGTGNAVGGTVTNTASGVIKIDNATDLTLQAGTYSNAGMISLNSDGNTTKLVIGAPNITLGGGGTVTMSGNVNNEIVGAATTDTLTNQETIQGSGSVGAGEMTLANSGTIDANQSTAALTVAANGGTTNTGTLEATAGGTLGFSGTTVTNTGGTINTSAGGIAASNSVIDGGTVMLAGGSLTSSTISGANVTVAGTGDLKLSTGVINNGTLKNSAEIEVTGGTGNAVGGTVTNTASGVIKIDNATDLTLQAGTYSNAGTISLNSDGNTTKLVIGAPNITLGGGGTVTMSGNVNNLIVGAASADTLTNQETIQGSGSIGGGEMGLVNSGTIIANQSVPLVINTSSSGFSNPGTLTVNTSETLQITANTPFTNFSGTTLTGGTYNVSGKLQFGASGTSLVTNAANITLTGAGSQIVDSAGNNILANFANNAAGATFALGAMRNFTTAGNFTNNGTLVVGAGDAFDVNGNLTNFSGTTLTGGAYKLTGTLQFNGADIVTNAADITLTGPNSSIVDQTGTNALANFSVNAAGATFALGANRNFTTAGNFTNQGSLTVGAGDTFDVNGNLKNFSGTTLTGGTYNLTGVLQFNNANIVTNAARITLTGTGSKIVNQSGVNALLNFANNASKGSFTLAGNQNLTTAGGSFTNAGTFTISQGSTFTVGGSSFNFTQSGGATSVNGTLTSSSAGTLDLNGGSLSGGGTLGYSVVDGATITPGASSTKTGDLAVTQTYTQESTGALDISIGGTAAKQFDQLNITCTGSLNGTLKITLANGFVPTMGSTFDILNASSVSGTFATVMGLGINSSEHFVVTYNGDDVVLMVAPGPAVAPTSSLRPRRQHTYSGLLAVKGTDRTFIPAHTYGLALAPQGHSVAPTIAPVSMGGSHGFRLVDSTPHTFRPMDDSPVAPIVPASGDTSGAESGVGGLRSSAPAAASFNNMPAMGHRRVEIGLDLKALLKAGPKRLVRALTADPESGDALTVGYVTVTASH